MNKTEFINKKLAEFKKMKKAEKLTKKLEKKINKIRESGFKLIILGSEVRITF